MLDYARWIIPGSKPWHKDWPAPEYVIATQRTAAETFLAIVLTTMNLGTRRGVAAGDLVTDVAATTIYNAEWMSEASRRFMRHGDGSLVFSSTNRIIPIIEDDHGRTRIQ
ncbi:MAG: hypothetical protein AB7W16_10575 [Candidatus Obscuribacterales bacterium]